MGKNKEFNFPLTVLFHFQKTVCGEVAAVATSPKQELYGKKNN